jgi:tetratricopeptide (TPR) repeat protein
LPPPALRDCALRDCYDKGVLRGLQCACCLASLFVSLGAPASKATAATVVVLAFHNNSSFENVNWVGESISETLRTELNTAGQIALDRETREAGERRLSLRPDARFTKGTLFKLGQILDTDYLIYGSYDIHLPQGETQLKNATIEVVAYSIELRKFHDGKSFTESGRLADLSKIEELLAFDYAGVLAPEAGYAVERFTAPAKLIRLDAKESYIRGLLSPYPEQKLKWFQQATTLDPAYTPPEFELGKVFLERKDYKLALSSLSKIPAGDQLYAAVRFRMGLAAYEKGDYAQSAAFFTEVAGLVPLNEVFNNLGAAESRLDQPDAIQEFQKAFEGDRNDAVYLFNLGLAFYKAGKYEEAASYLRRVLDREPGDRDAQSLLERSEQKQPFSAQSGRPAPGERLKLNFDETAFRVLKAMLQPSK